MPQSQVCSVCGEPAAIHASYCGACGATLDQPDVDPLANAVAGSPVRAGQVPHRDGLIDVRERFRAALPEVASTVANQMHRLARGLPPESQRWLERNGWRMHAALPSYRAAAVPIAPRPLPIPVRLLWCMVVGIWLMPFWIVFTWIALCTVVALPFAARMVALAPTVLTLRQPPSSPGPWYTALSPALPRPLQHDLAVRAAYFVFVGVWASLLWTLVAYALSLSGVGLRTGSAMFDLAPTIAHLERR